MKAGIRVKSLAARAAGAFGIADRKLRELSRTRFPILMYHRVLPPVLADPKVQEGMYVTPETFEAHVRFLKERFRMVSLPERCAAASGTRQAGPAGPECVLTFDDGWQDFYRFAYPVLRKHGVPATVFLPTRYIGTFDRFWTDRLASLLHRMPPADAGHGGEAAWPPLAERIARLQGSLGDRLEGATGTLKKCDESDIEAVLAALASRAAPGEEGSVRDFLDWQEVREMAASGIVSFGSHTHTHRILTHLTETEIREELRASREALLREGAADASFVAFCYPNGGLDARVVALVREAGYQAAVTTESGWNAPGEPLFELKRIAVHEDMTATRDLFGCRIAGIL